MSEYHVGCGLFGIYAGILKNSHEWRNKSEVTDEAVNAVRDYMVDHFLGGIECSKGVSGAYMWKLKDGGTVELRVTVDKEQKESIE